MKTIVAVVSLLLASHALCGEVCYEPQSESRFYLTLSMGELFIAQDFTQGLWLISFGPGPNSDSWCLVDLNTNYTYLSTPATGCKYHLYTAESNELFGQCLPPRATEVNTGSLIDFYYQTLSIMGEEFSWVIGVTPVDGTPYYKRSVSRFEHAGVVDREVGILADYSSTISDPTIFNKDLSSCVDGLI
ncbi:hypothetical protein PoB_004637000 [Plakobranchus ocellatus]|uniref:Uncharacterized protein n=1 Tax=Plakobranchus ocellatus TaxID=259542 RepID=A0AAV4BK59_9GAST|nr:hypothetical protein PoB_004637000 [Plakobranchus ocellatus]